MSYICNMESKSFLISVPLTMYLHISLGYMVFVRTYV